MGSVPDLYTTGDNDPEIDPVQYYRHYLYCDACGSFELQSWMAPRNHAELERARRWLGKAALYSSPLVVVSGWLALGLVPALSVLVLLAAGIALALIERGFIRKALWGVGQPSAARWRFFKVALLWLLVVLGLESLAWHFGFSIMILAGLILIIGLLVARAFLGSKIELLGLRCPRCNATYAHGTPFFADLDANPRNLTVADVLRPLGVSPFKVGKSVDYEPPDPPRRFPP
jgi:hypothetical protein